MVNQQASLSNCHDVLQVGTERIVNSITEVSRFSYVRFASGLVREGVSLLHQLVIIKFAAHILIWTLTLHLSPYYTHSLMVKFCAKQDIREHLELCSCISMKML